MAYKYRGYIMNCSSALVKKKNKKKRKENMMGLRERQKFLSRPDFPCTATVQFFVSFPLPFSDRFFFLPRNSIVNNTVNGKRRCSGEFHCRFRWFVKVMFFLDLLRSFSRWHFWQTDRRIPSTFSVSFCLLANAGVRSEFWQSRKKSISSS